MQVNIYTYSTIKGPRKRDGTIGYVLEAITDKGPATLTGFKKLEQTTENQSELIALNTALARLNKECELKLYTHSKHIGSAYSQSWIEKWQQSDWKNAKGDDVANAEEWKKMLNLLNTHQFIFYINEANEYDTWLKNETEKKNMEE